MTLDEIVAWLNATYPSRDWDQRCAQLVWNVVHIVSGTDEVSMATYDPAKAAYRASVIVSTDSNAAPSGAIHYWANPSVEGHVAVGLGGETVLMTGTEAALNGGTLLGNNYGVTTVAAYSSRRGNPYLGWSRAYGANASIVGEIGGTNSTLIAGEEEDEEMKAMFYMTGKTYNVLVWHPVSGLAHEYSTGSGDYNNKVAANFGTGSFLQVDKSHYDRMKADLANVRAGK